LLTGSQNIHSDRGGAIVGLLTAHKKTVEIAEIQLFEQLQCPWSDLTPLVALND
jgi:hypothetical protein